MNISPPLISVLIPCYNAEQTLLETVQSVQSQSYSHWEIIIVDDGSTDRSVHLTDKLARQPNIQVIHTQNQGVSAARNLAACFAKGEYLAFLDADDIWYRDKLKRQLEFFKQNKKLGVCYSRVRFTSPSGKPLKQYSAVPKKPLSAIDLLVENHLCTSSNIMCLKQVFTENNGFDTSMRYAEDQEWLIRIALNNQWNIAGIPHVLMDYRTQTNSLSSSLEKMEDGWKTLINKVSQYAPVFIKTHDHRARAIYLRYLARRALRQGEPAQIGLHYIKRAIKSDWRILLVSPWRSFATLFGLIFYWSMPSSLHINKQ